MIDSEKSGIAFSVHPVTQDNSQILIEAGFGLGEAIVSGAITPDAYTVSKKDNKVVDINVNDQIKALYRKSSGGNEWKELGEKGKKQILSKKEILKLSEIIKKIENHYGVPQDIEWAFVNGKFYITQSRPITTLRKESQPTYQEYHKLMNRTMFLSECEMWDQGERIEMPKVLFKLIFFDPLFYYERRKGISVYYNFSDSSQGLEKITNFFNKSTQKLDKLKEIFDQDCETIKTIIKNGKDGDFNKLFNKIVAVWPLIAISNVLGDKRDNVRGVKESLRKKFIQIRKESDGVIHWGGESFLDIGRNKLPKKYQPWAEFLLFKEIKNNKFPNLQELKKRKRRYIYHQGKLYIDTKLEEYAKENNIKIIEEQVDKNKVYETIRGTSAYQGKAKGKAKILLDRNDIKKIKKGDILVTPMTTPNLISAMQKAKAFITDEGGVTCHAAIVARELKKPCIIGTKIATRVLCDEDLVEVDASKGVIKIIKTTKNKNILKREDYQHFMQHKGSVSFGSSFGLLWSTKDMEGLVLYSKNKRQTFISKRSMLKTLDEGNKLYSDKKFILKIKNELDYNFNKLRQETKKIENNGITKQKFINFLDYIDTLDKFYRYTDLFYTDKYFKTHKPSKKFIKDFENIKLTGRSYINDAIYIKNSFTERLLKQISKKFNVAYQDISEYTTSEIFDLFNNKKRVENSILKKRRKAHVIYADEHEKVNILIGDEAIDFIEDFTKKESAIVLKGQTASTGTAKGIARVIHVSVDDFDGIKKIRKETKKGEILVTDSTIPEIIEACKKVSAIVTNQGGMMSHAAIVSRELGIPCIVGVANATETIKTGDFIEVDADKSIVRTIKT